MELEAALRSLPVQEWKIRQVVVLDWYDGPREGICAMATPACYFYFHVLDERMSCEDLDDRLFQLSEIAPDIFTQILSMVSDLGSPTDAVWVPLWSDRSEVARQVAARHLQEILGKRRQTNVVIRTCGMQHFLGCWTVQQAGDDTTD